MSNKYPEPQTYTPPVSHLLTTGDGRHLPAWPDYPATYGLTLEHVPDLIRMMQDEGLNWADSESDEVWAPIHAWRALGQLRATAATDALVAILPTVDEHNNEWAQEELPDVFALIGPATIPALQAYLAHPSNGLWSRVTAAKTLAKLDRQYPAARDRCVAILAAQLANHQEQEPTLNAFLISALTDLRALEASAIMEQAFAAGSVDLSVQGDWEEVQIELGLLRERVTLQPRYGWIPPEMIPLAQLFERFRGQSLDSPEDEQRQGEEARARRRQAQPRAQKRKQKQARKKKRRRR